jgi:hypothetical protein
MKYGVVVAWVGFDDFKTSKLPNRSMLFSV